MAVEGYFLSMAKITARLFIQQLIAIDKVGNHLAHRQA
jgi:hypothetical protein